MKVTITPRSLKGEIQAIASKSQAHRLLICAAFSDEPTEIICPTSSKDIEATISCLKALGAKIEYNYGAYNVVPIKEVSQRAELDCGESGSTLRFMLPIVCTLGVEASFILHGRLGERPLEPLQSCLAAHGAVITKPETNILSCSGRIKSGEYEIAANVSSQFISGLLMALPLLGEGSSLKLISRIESYPYIDMTRQAQSHFGAFSAFKDNCFAVPGLGCYHSPGVVEVEGDWSNAAFWLAAGVECHGLDMNSAQGDRAVVECIERIKQGNAVIDAADIPDLVPILSVVAATVSGKTEFINAGRLRIKESDRIKSVCKMLYGLGANAHETEDGLTVVGNLLTGGAVKSENDHRIAMSAAIASCFCSGTVTILGAEAVNKSYPGFWDDFVKLGGHIEVEE